MEDSLEEFKTPKVIKTKPKQPQPGPSNARKRGKTAKPKEGKRKNDIRKVFKRMNDDLVSYNDEFNKVCKNTGIDVDAEQLQIAIALSKSLHELKNPDETSEADDNSKCRKDAIKKTLAEYGFKTNNPVKPKKNRKSTGLKAQSKVINFNDNERKQILADRYAKVLLDGLENRVLSNEISVRNLSTPLLESYRSRERRIIDKSGVNYNAMSNENDFFYTNIIDCHPNTVGTLLKDWSKIPGRTASPERNERKKDILSKLIETNNLDSFMTGCIKDVSHLRDEAKFYDESQRESIDEIIDYTYFNPNSDNSIELKFSDTNKELLIVGINETNNQVNLEDISKTDNFDTIPIYEETNISNTSKYVENDQKNVDLCENNEKNQCILVNETINLSLNRTKKKSCGLEIKLNETETHGPLTDFDYKNYHMLITKNENVVNINKNDHDVNISNVNREVNDIKIKNHVLEDSSDLDKQNEINKNPSSDIEIRCDSPDLFDDDVTIVYNSPILTRTEPNATYENNHSGNITKVNSIFMDLTQCVNTYAKKDINDDIIILNEESKLKNSIIKNIDLTNDSSSESLPEVMIVLKKDNCDTSAISKENCAITINEINSKDNNYSNSLESTPVLESAQETTGYREPKAHYESMDESKEINMNKSEKFRSSATKSSIDTKNESLNHTKSDNSQSKDKDSLNNSEILISDESHTDNGDTTQSSHPKDYDMINDSPISKMVNDDIDLSERNQYSDISKRSESFSFNLNDSLDKKNPSSSQVYEPNISQETFEINDEELNYSIKKCNQDQSFEIDNECIDDYNLDLHWQDDLQFVNHENDLGDLSQRSSENDQDFNDHSNENSKLEQMDQNYDCIDISQGSSNEEMESSTIKDLHNDDSKYLPNVTFGDGSSKSTLNKVGIGSSKVTTNKILATPKCSKVLIKTKNVTPKPNFNCMSTPEIKSQLDKFGVKTLSKRRAIELLDHIYGETHPYIDETQLRLIKGNPMKRLKTSDGSCDMTNPDRNSSEENNEVQIEVDIRIDKEQGSHTNDDVETESSDRTVYNTVTECKIIGDINEDSNEWIFTKREKPKLYSCKVPMHIVIHNYITSRPLLYEYILQYKPIEIDIVHRQLVEDGYRFDAKDLLKFMDRKCITVKTTDNNSRNKRKITK